MNAKQLIQLAHSKGYGINRDRPGVYGYGYSDGTNWISKNFTGTWNEFVNFIKNIQPPHAFTLEYKLCDAPDEIWTAPFSFNAANQEDADNKAYKWARYQGRDVRDVKARPATEHEAQNWIRNEYIN